MNTTDHNRHDLPELTLVRVLLLAVIIALGVFAWIGILLAMGT